MLDEVAVEVAEGHLLMGVGGVVVVKLLLLTTAQKDEMLRLASDRKFACPYYKYFDEYKMVRKQN